MDGERGTLSSGFMSPVISAFIENETISEECHQDLFRQKLFANASLKDNALAQDIIDGGRFSDSLIGDILSNGVGETVDNLAKCPESQGDRKITNFILFSKY